MKKRWIAGLFLAVVTMWFACWGIMMQFPDNHGTYGDMFGAVNALFSGLAFAGLICTLIVQMQELKAQREELKATKEELAGQKQVMQEQSDSIKQQNFEQLFFRLLELLKEQREGISYSEQNGTEALSTMLEYLTLEVDQNTEAEIGGASWNASRLDQIKGEFNCEFWTQWSGRLGSYLATFNRILDLLDDTESVNQQLYGKVLSSWISSPEKKFILYAALGGDFESLLLRCNRYGLLENIDLEELGSKFDVEFFDVSAFGFDYYPRHGNWNFEQGIGTDPESIAYFKRCQEESAQDLSAS